MTPNEFIALATKFHTRTVVGLLDAVERAATPAQRTERLALIRDAVLEFKDELLKALKP